MFNEEKRLDRPYRWAMIGGGRGSQIGYIHIWLDQSCNKGIEHIYISITNLMASVELYITYIIKIVAMLVLLKPSGPTFMLVS